MSKNHISFGCICDMVNFKYSTTLVSFSALVAYIRITVVDNYIKIITVALPEQVIYYIFGLLSLDL